MKEIGYVGFAVIDSLTLIMVSNIFFTESNNSDNLYTEPNLYESDVTSARDNDSTVDSTKFETRVNGTPEVDEEHYNHITLKIDLNPKYNRDDTDLSDMYSHIKTTHPPSRVT